MPPADSGFFESSYSRTRSLIHTNSVRPRAISQRRSLQRLFSHKYGKKTAPARPPRRASQSSIPARSDTMRTISLSSSPSKKSKSSSMLSSKKRCSKRSVSTIMRAVPATTACATAPLSPLERDMATLPNQEILFSIGRLSPSEESQASSQDRSLSTGDIPLFRQRSTATTALSPIQSGTEMNFPDLRSTATSFRTSKITHKNSVLSEHRSINSTKSQRPRIHVVIPTEQRNRPLPTSPFFGQTPFSSPRQSSNHIVTASAEFASMNDVSPPSGSKKNAPRTSVVSPLSAHHQPVGHLHPSLNSQLTKSASDPALQSSSTAQASSSSDESHGEDGSSVCSKRSSISMSSVEASTPPPTKPTNMQELTPSATVPIQSPSVIRVFQSEADAPRKSEEADTEAEPRSAVRPRRYAPHPPIEHDHQFRPTCSHRPLRCSSGGLQRRPTVTRRASRESSNSKRRSISVDPSVGVINEAINRSESKQLARGASSPTLSEAEEELEQHLSSFTEEDVVANKDDAAEDVVVSPPALPRKSSKRASRILVPQDHIAFQLEAARSLGKSRGLTIDIPGQPEDVVYEVSHSPVPIPPKAMRRMITPAGAENVILAILENLETLEDLFATAVINQGFYRVFKRYEVDLMKATLRKMSPPAWEHLEICYPGHDQDPDDLDNLRRGEYTPATYLESYKRDKRIIKTLKSMVKHKCQSFLRPEVVVALNSKDSSESARVDDAFWRIWSFCKIFGSGKGREEDIVAQMDWLKGGVLVHQKTCTHSIFTTESIDMNDTLANAPDCFAKGNEGGLTAEQLFDMMELWNCLGVLLQPFEGRTIQAREYGVYDSTDVRGGDIDGEEMMLDEWYYYLLTLGLSSICNLAIPCRRADPAAFKLAQQNGWIAWSPPLFGGSRRNFLKEAASRVYEDKIAVIYAESSTKEVQRQLSKQRIQRHIDEIRKRKDSGERIREVRMSQERPMSEWSTVIGNLTRPRPEPETSIVSHIPSLRSAAQPSGIGQNLSVSIQELSARTPPQTRLARTVAQPLLPTPPPSTVPSVADRSSIAPSMPPIDEHPAFRKRNEAIPEVPSLADHPAFSRHLKQMSSSSSPRSSEDNMAFQQHPLQRNILQSDSSVNSADKAVYRIVEMGFTPEQARQALRRTDLGDGLRVDRAVELLLREVL